MIKKVAFLFWGLIPILLVYILFTFNDYIDINIHDTYVVFPKYLVVVLVILLFFSTGLGYYLAYYSEKFTPIKVLTIFHVILLFTGMLVLYFSPIFKSSLPAQDVHDMMENVRESRLNLNVKFYAVLCIVIAQILFLFNLTLSLFRK